MKILIPNAKELNTAMDSQPWQPLSEKSHQLLQQFLSLSEADLAAFYKLKSEKATLEYDRFQRMATQQAKTYPALFLYDGLMYRYMTRRDMSPIVRNYWQQTVRIATGFYGLIAPFHLICPHRLDFQGKFQVAGQSLKHYWRGEFDREMEGEELVVSLLSSEFEQVFSPDVQEKMIKVVFMEEKDGVAKVHSTISKKGRGRLVSLMAELAITDLDGLKGLQFDGFAYQEERSTDRKLVFVRCVN